MRGLPYLLLLAVPLLSACRPDPTATGAVRADIAYQGFRPGCLKLSAVDEAAPEQHSMELELPLSSLDREGSRTIAVFRGQDWSGKLLLTASAFEKSCQGQVVARQAAHVVVPSLDVATVPFSLTAVDADGDGYVSKDAPLPGSDCDDHHDAIHPGQPELCDALDNDCDGVVDNPGTCAAGAAWAPRSDTGAGDLHAVATFGLGKAWVAGSGGALRLRSGSGGFVDFDGACAGDWEAAWAAPTGQVYLAGKAGGLASHPLSGACADQFTTAAGADLHALSGTVRPDGTPALFAVGESGFAYSWSPPDAPVALPRAGTTRLLGAAALSPTRLLAVGEDPGPTPRILRFDGAQWSPDTLPSGLPALSALRSVHAVSDTLAYAVGDNGILLQYDGTRWTRRPPPLPGTTQPTLTRVVAFGPSDVYVSASDGKVRRFDGSAWTELSPPLPPLWDLAVPRPDELWAISAQGEVLHWPEGTP